MKIVAFMNQKGGVGKTTSAVNIGSLLANEFGKKVLLIDLDPQGNMSDHVGIYPDATEKSVYNVIIDGLPATEVLQHVHGMDILPANIDLSAAEVELVSMLSRELRLRNAVIDLCSGYDYVLLDCPPSLGLLTISGLALAHEVLVPMEAEYLALKGLSQLANTLELVRGHLNPELVLGGVVFCMYAGNTLLAQGVREEVENYFPGKVYGNFVRRNVRLAEAPSHGQPINIYDARCAGTEDYRAVTEEFLSRNGDEDIKKKQNTLPESIAPVKKRNLEVKPDTNECLPEEKQELEQESVISPEPVLPEPPVQPEKAAFLPAEAPRKRVMRKAEATAIVNASLAPQWKGDEKKQTPPPN